MKSHKHDEPSSTLEKFQKEFDDDMNALDALTKQAEQCQAVIDIIRKMPENEAWVVIGAGVGGHRPDAEINLRGLGCDEVAALLAVTNTTMEALRNAILEIHQKYPGILEDESGGKSCGKKVENHYHYHFHGVPDTPPGHWHNHPAPPPPDDDGEKEPMEPPGCDCEKPNPPSEEPGDEGLDYDDGDGPDDGTEGAAVAYADGGWGKPEERPVCTDSGLNLD